jgi:hypothetical protein
VFPPAVPEQPETLPEHSGIRVHASVTMNRAHLASLRREDFVISEGRRQQQPIGALVQESLPVDLVIVLPRVWSELNVNINATIGQQLELAAQRVLRGLHPKDRVAVVSYGPEPRLEHSITQDREAIDGAIRRVRVAVQNAEVDEESLKLEKVLASLRVAIPPLWWTAINTKSLAIDYAQHVLQETPQENRRKVIFMVSDLFPGAEGDNYAGTPDEPVIQRLWDAGIVLSAMGLGRREPLRDHTRRQPVDATYRRNNPMHIAQATGGDALVVEDPAGLDDVLAHAREHYVLWFDQPEGLAPGQERTITVELSPDARKRFPDATVRARQGYITR